MDVLQDLSYMGAIAQARSWDKTHGCGGSSSVCMVHLTSQTNASHILPPPSHLTAWALQADGFQSVFIYLMWFSYQGDRDLQGGTFLASGGGKLIQITQELRMAPGTELRIMEALDLAHVRCPRPAAVQRTPKVPFPIESV